MLLPLVPQTAYAADEPRLFISTVKTSGGNTSEKTVEYIELYNAGLADVSLDGWFVEYAKPSSGRGPESCGTDPWDSPDLTVTEVTLSGTVFWHDALRVPLRMNDNVAGSLRLVRRVTDDSVVVHDVVGWGSETSVAYCFEGTAAVIPKGDTALMRCTVDGIPDDVNDNSRDFQLIAVGDGPEPCEPPLVDESDEDETLDPIVYYPVEITELLPDPGAGLLDSEDEFIELYNPNEFAVNIEGYRLFTGSASKSYEYALPDLTLAPKAYVALYARDTKLSLVNTTGYAWIEAPDGTLLSETHWYENIKSDIAWALIDNAWVATNQPTPGAANKASLIDEAAAKAANTELPPCGEGRYRHPETNRCRNIETATSELVPCREGQVRNPDTNRCRAITTASSDLTPCRPGQERNPETNRCRNVAAATTELKPCQEGYERNPETNRCRKIAVNTAAALAGETTQARPDYTLIGIGLAAAFGYAAYEYRQDFGNALHKIRTQRTINKSAGK